MKDIYARTNNICLVFITLCLATVALIYMRPVLIPLIFSVFAYSILTPMVNRIRAKTNVPKALAVFISLLGLFLLLTGIVIILVSSIENFIEGAPKYKESLSNALSFLEQQLLIFNVDLDLAQFNAIVQSSSFLNFAKNLGGQLFSFLGNLFLVFIFAIFMMTGESRSRQKSPLLKEVLLKVSSYVSSKFLLSLTTGVLVWIVLLVFRVELAFIFALLTVLLNFIPTIGSIAAVILPLPVVLLQYQLGIEFFTILTLTGAIQITIGNIIEPKVMGDSMDLHPITIMACLVFWGMVWGVAGMFLAVPITAVLKIVFSRIEATQTMAEIMAGRLPERS